MKYFVYYDYGSCNYGDHDSGLQEFDSLAAAIEFVNTYQDGRILAEERSGWGSYRIIEGREVPTITLKHERAGDVDDTR